VSDPFDPNLREKWTQGFPGARNGFSGYLSDSLEERESGWSRRRSARARNERTTHSGAGS